MRDHQSLRSNVSPRAGRQVRHSAPVNFAYRLPLGRRVMMN
jgi:hypothetical protein